MHDLHEARLENVNYQGGDKAIFDVSLVTVRSTPVRTTKDDVTTIVCNVKVNFSYTSVKIIEEEEVVVDTGSKNIEFVYDHEGAEMHKQAFDAIIEHINDPKT